MYEEELIIELNFCPGGLFFLCVLWFSFCSKGLAFSIQFRSGVSLEELGYGFLSRDSAIYLCLYAILVRTIPRRDELVRLSKRSHGNGLPFWASRFLRGCPSGVLACLFFSSSPLGFPPNTFFLSVFLTCAIIITYIKRPMTPLLSPNEISIYPIREGNPSLVGRKYSSHFMFALPRMTYKAWAVARYSRSIAYWEI